MSKYSTECDILMRLADELEVGMERPYFTLEWPGEWASDRRVYLRIEGGQHPIRIVATDRR